MGCRITGRSWLSANSWFMIKSVRDCSNFLDGTVTFWEVASWLVCQPRIAAQLPQL
jgi:hypothetical protein